MINPRKGGPGRAWKLVEIAKFVRKDKVDGCYLPEMTGGEPIWNWRPPKKGEAWTK
jgi:hypothetical protein